MLHLGSDQPLEQFGRVAETQLKRRLRFKLRSSDDEKRYVHPQRNGKHNSSGGGPSKSTHPQRHGRDSNSKGAGPGGGRRRTNRVARAS